MISNVPQNILSDRENDKYIRLLQLYLEKHGVAKYELAAQLNLSPSAISQWLHRKCRISRGYCSIISAMCEDIIEQEEREAQKRQYFGSIMQKLVAIDNLTQLRELDSLIADRYKEYLQQGEKAK